MEGDVVIRLQGGRGAEKDLELLAGGGAPGCPLAGRGDARKLEHKSGKYGRLVSRWEHTRGKLAEERDVTMARLVKKGLEMHPRQDRANRPVWA